MPGCCSVAAQLCRVYLLYKVLLLLFTMQVARPAWKQHDACPHRSSRQGAETCYNMTSHAKFENNNLADCQPTQDRNLYNSSQQHENVCRSSVAAPVV